MNTRMFRFRSDSSSSMTIRPYRYRFLRNIAIIFVSLLLLAAVVFALYRVVQKPVQAAAQQITQVSAGNEHSLAIDASGKAYAWGYNANGAVGDGSTTDRNVPVAVDTTGTPMAGKTIKQVAAGGLYSAALDTDGKIYTWGNNSNGEHGNGTTAGSTKPVAVDTTGTPMAGKTITSIAAGSYHLLALDSAGIVYAWGLNGYGELGDGTTTTRTKPVAVDTTGTPMAGKTIVAVSSGMAHSLALDSDGNVYAWGRNGEGRLGDGTTTTRTKPVAVDTTGTPMAGKKITQISAGRATDYESTHSHSLALDENGVVYAWGGSDSGRLGDDSGVSQSKPVAVKTTGTPMAGKTVTHIATSSAGSVARTSDGSVYAWGYNGEGQLGDGTTTNRTVPVRAYGGALAQNAVTVASIAAGDDHMVVIASDGKVYSWGYNYYGELGNGTSGSSAHSSQSVAVSFTYNFTPFITTISPNSGRTTGGETMTITGGNFVVKDNRIVQVAAGADHTLALDALGKVYSWGANGSGQLGNGTTTASSYPIDISASGALSGKKITKIAAGSTFSLALDADGKVYSWGNNGSGRLGNGNKTNQSMPVQVVASGVLSGKTITQISAGNDFSLALDSNGKMYAWGESTDGSLGNGVTYSDKDEPVAVTDGSISFTSKTITQISAGTDHVLALDSAGKAYAWGEGGNGRLGRGSTTDASVPIEVTSTGALNGKVLVGISAGYQHSLAVDSNGKAYAWGNGVNGRLGQSSTSSSNVPIAVTDTGVLSGKAITRVAAGTTYSLALSSDGKVYAWGSQLNGQLGNSMNTFTDQTAPVATTGAIQDKNVTQITTGGTHSLALAADGAIFGWGVNLNGQLGNGFTYASQSLPGRVSTTAPSALASVAPSTPRVTIGGVEATNVTIVNPTTITATVPAHAAGAADVTVNLGSGDPQYMATRAGGYTYRTIGVPTSITPNNGTQDGGTAVTITGTDFALKENKIVQVAMGSGHSLAVSATGKVYGWGVGTNGRLGIGAETHFSYPTTVKTQGTPMEGKRIVQVAGGNSHSLALDSDGKVYAWGANANGQLGNNNTGVDALEPVAVNASGVLNGKRIVQIAAGNSHSLALDSDGKVYAWGMNNYGQLGNNATVDSAVPVAVLTSGEFGSKTITQISAGNVHSTAVASDGRAYAWGRNNYGQLGDNTTTDRSVPTYIVGSVTLIQLAAGDFHTVALDSAGKVYAWGYNAQGQIGDNTTTNKSIGTDVSASGALAGKSIKRIAAGYYHSIAIDANGDTYSWGFNDNGQIGNNNRPTNATTPVAVAASGTPMDGMKIREIAGGYYNTLALDETGKLYSWGLGDHGRLGNFGIAPSHVPVAVATTGASALATMEPFTPAVYFDGVPATNATLVNSTTITATTPAHAPGPVNVTIDLGGGDVAYRATLANGYTYVTPPPAAPTNLTATPADTGVQLAWTAPQNTGGSPISDYRIEYSPDHGATWQVYDDGVSTATSLLVPTPPLEAGTTYRFRVAAINQTGQGLWSNQPEAAMRYVSVAAPTAVSIDVTPGSSARMSSGSHAANVSTNSVTGYTLSLAANNQTLTHANNSDTINSVGGTPATPTQLAGASWGFRVPNIAGFGSGGTVEQNVATSNYLWAGLPAPASAAIIRTQTAAVENQSTTVWYGVSIPPEQPAGTYAQTVTYTAVARD